MKLFVLSILIILFHNLLIAQNPSLVIQDFLEQNATEQKLSAQDIATWKITNQHQSSTSGATHVYIQQIYQGIPISNGLANFTIKEHKVWSMGNRLVANISQKVTTTNPTINSTQAIQFAAQHLQLDAPTGLEIIKKVDHLEFIHHKGQLSKKNIPVRLRYRATSETEIKLVWDLSIYTLDSKHWWSVQIDAQDGSLINQNDWVLNCTFEHNNNTKCGQKTSRKNTTTAYTKAPETLLQPDQYTVFALPVESPMHGTRSIVSNPADTLASPYGWHDTSGVAGAEYTITRGNNVYAYEDVGSSNTPGFSPDGGALLEFNFPYNSTAAPSLYQSAAISNLFYMNNMMHDIWYQYGFDEASGNFQNNNYGRSGTAGIGGDEVFAEAQDSANINNARFIVLPDGESPKMELFLWNSTGSVLGGFLDINLPLGIAGSYTAAGAAFGSGLPTTPLTADLILIEDNFPPIHDACETITNSTALSGKIALIDKGSCSFVTQVEAAQNAGAIAVIIINDTPGAPFQLLGNSTIINIPSIMIGQNDGILIKNQLSMGSVNVSIGNNGVVNLRDSDVDNGIIAHEYGHGISTRLTHGASNVNCLKNAEQMGEGWSDWFALMLTIEPGDSGSDPRGIGNYVSNQLATGQGLRPAPYSTDFAINSFTYGASNNVGQISEPHGIGFIFATVLWDLNWALIDEYGGLPDPDLYRGTGGNNIAMHLIIEALKIQPCRPGMIDGRDAILSADQLLYGGMHQCLIWDVFAKRGFGYSANQGSSDNRKDQVEAFDLPTTCQIATVLPTADFSPNGGSYCRSIIKFFDNSTNVPQSWFWDFGDGNTSTLQNPTHSYNASGPYIITLIVSNTIGTDTIAQQLTINNNLPPIPIANDLDICLGDTAYVPAMGTGIIYWKDTSNRVIQVGDTLCIPNVTTKQTYYAENGSSFLVWPTPLGLANNMIGSGGYHQNSYHGALNFTADRSFEILSAKVYALGAGPRTFYLASGTNNDGLLPNNNQIVDQITINLVDGPQRINLNLVVPEAGYYNLGSSDSVNLFRTTIGVSYPYVQPGFISINSSSASGNQSSKYYYYFYDLKIRGPRCVSPLDTITITPIVSAFSSIDNNGIFTFTDASTGATSWFWDFGDNNTSTQQNPTHTYTSSGNYTVTLSINNGGCIRTETVSVFLGLSPIQSAKPQIKLLPNPTSDFTSLLLDKALQEDLNIQITDIHGKNIQLRRLASGQVRLNLDLSKLPSAVYLVHIKGDTFLEVRKLVVE